MLYCQDGFPIVNNSDHASKIVADLGLLRYWWKISYNNPVQKFENNFPFYFSFFFLDRKNKWLFFDRRKQEVVNPIMKGIQEFYGIDQFGSEAQKCYERRDRQIDHYEIGMHREKTKAEHKKK